MNISKCCPDVVFNSQNGSAVLLPITFTETAPLQTLNQAVGSVVLNTSCLKHADILIDFSGILNVTTTVSAFSILVFTLFRNCRGADFREPLTTFTFYVSDVTGGVTTSHTLVFQYLTKNNCEDCCSYDLELNSISNIGAGTVTYAINGVISALATGS